VTLPFTGLTLQGLDVVELPGEAFRVSHDGRRATLEADPAAFLGRIAPARSTGWFSGSHVGFSFRSNPGVSTDRGYALLGQERNGAFLT
jgi:hypothetical protein